MTKNNFLITKEVHESILQHSYIKEIVIDAQIVFPELSNNVIGYSNDFDYYFAIIPEIVNIQNLNNKMSFDTIFEKSNFKLKMNLASALDRENKDIIENIAIGLKYSLLLALLYKIKDNKIYNIKSVNDYLPTIIDKFVDFANLHNLPFKNIFEKT